MRLKGLALAGQQFRCPFMGVVLMFKKIGKQVVAFAPVAGLGGLAANAYAAVPTAVTDAIAAVETDSVTVATAMIGVIAALLVFSYIRKQLH